MDSPSTTAFGPFELVSRLGQGGAGEVWRARVPGQPLDIAVKLLRDDRWHDASLSHFLDEARATAGLDHPHLVQVLDFGTVDEAGRAVPYLAMDLASGGTLGQRARDLDWEALSTALLQVLDGLAHAHARGVTHLDIKAENVLLGLPGDGRPGWRVVDFGIAHALGSAGPGTVSGTPTHMAPEQWRGTWRDFGPWTDLYAVGCMIWHLVTGGPLYRSAVLMELAQVHMAGQRPPFRPVRPVPADLEAWLARALQPDLSARFQHVADAADAWRALGPPVGNPGHGDASAPAPDEASMETLDIDTLPESERSTDRAVLSAETLPIDALPDTVRNAPTPDVPASPVAAPASTRPLPAHWSEVERPAVPLSMGVLGLGMVASRVPPLVGRDTHRDALWDALRQVAQTRSPHALCLHGPAGCGKSRLATWLVRAAALGNHANGLVIRHSSALDGEAALADALVRFLRCPDQPDAIDAASRVDRFLERANAHDPEDRALVLDLATGASTSPTALVRCLHLAARLGPLILVLDDASRAPESMGLVRALAGPVLVLATWEGDPTLDDPWTGLQVAALPDGHMTELVERMLPLDPPSVGRLVSGADGNPEEAVQRILHHVRSGDLVPSGDRYALVPDAKPPADGLDDHWQRRIDAAIAPFGPDAEEALALAAALGSRVEDSEWQAVLGSAPDRALEVALHDGGIALRVPRDTGWRFAHPRVRALLERRARSARLWAQANQRCAEVLAARDAPEGRVGTHLLEAGQHEAALAPLLAAAEAAFSGGRPHAAAVHLADLDRAFAALGRPEADPDRIDALVVASRLDRQRHGPAAAIPSAERALELARRDGDPDRIAKAGRSLAMAIRSARRTREATELLQSLLDDPGPRMGTAQRSRLLAAYGVCLCDLLADGPDTVERAKAALTEAVELGGLSEAQRGDALLYRSRLPRPNADKRRLLQLALDTYAGAGSTIGRAISNYDLATVAQSEGAPEAALTHYREAARLFDLHRAHAANTARLGIGTTLCHLDRHEEADAVFAGVVDTGRRMGRHALHFLGLCGQMRCAAAGADWSRLTLLLDQASGLVRGIELTSGESNPHLAPAVQAAREAGRAGLADQLEALSELSSAPARTE